MKILVLASTSISAELRRAKVGEEIDDAEVLVSPPALNPSTLRFWMSDADQAISRASEVRVVGGARRSSASPSHSG